MLDSYDNKVDSSATGQSIATSLANIKNQFHLSPHEYQKLVWQIESHPLDQAR